MSTVLQNQHKNAKGEWVKCEATVRACRYKANMPHREVEVEVGETPAPQETDFVDTPYRWHIVPTSLPEVEKKIAALNRRLLKASEGQSEVFEIETELITKVDPDTGVEYQVMAVSLNRPRIVQNGYEFVARVDEIHNEETDEVSFITSSISDGNVQDNIELKPNYCDHCGQTRQRNKTYVIKTPEGEYKQIGSSCMRSFLGISPSLWAFDPEYLKEKTQSKDFSARIGFSRGSPVNTKQAIRLALALTNGGKYYAGAQSPRMSTKVKLGQYLWDPKIRKEMIDRGEVYEGDWEEQTETILNELKFEGSTDYERNMRTLLSQEYVDPKHLGFVISAIPAYARQQGLKKVQKPVKVKAVGFIGEPGKKIEKEIPVTVTDKRYISVPGRYYNQPDQHVAIITMRTADNKQLTWFSASKAADDIEKGSSQTIIRATVKSHEVNSYDDNEETLIKLVKFK